MQLLNIDFNLFSKHYENVKQFGFRSCLTAFQAWSGSKQLAEVISRQQKQLKTNAAGSDMT